MKTVLIAIQPIEREAWQIPSILSPINVDVMPAAVSTTCDPRKRSPCASRILWAIKLYV